MPKFYTVRHAALSLQLNLKTLSVLALLLPCVLACVLLALSAGSQWLSPLTVLNELVADGRYAFVLETLRLPRIVMAFMVGAALAVSGLMLQSLIRNPLASPDIIGITGGASAAAVFFLSFLAGSLSVYWLPVAAIIGALLTALIIYGLAWQGGVSPVRLVLIGIGLAAGMNAITTLMIVLSPIATSMTAYVWLTGSVYGTNWQDVSRLLPWLLVLLPWAMSLARSIDAQALGDATAINLGIALQRDRLLVLFISVGLAGAAVAFAGAVSFVGLIAPHIARLLVDRRFASLAPVSALIGGTLVVLADTLGRTVFLPLDMPAGVFVAAVGAPFFIYLLYRHQQ